MKFFYKNQEKTLYNKVNNKKKVLRLYESSTENVPEFIKFICKDGLLTKGRSSFLQLNKNLNWFFYQNCNFIFDNYPNIKWIVDDLVTNNLNYISIFNITTNLIKPPFVIKSVAVPKKLRKKTKQKYVIKIVYKNENKRLKSSFKQLYYYSNQFSDNKFNVRLYKSLVFSFLDWKNSHLFKLKTMVFKKFFKF